MSRKTRITLLYAGGLILMALLPWMPFIAGDWIMSPTRLGMTEVERAIYIDLLCYQWLDGWLPNDHAKLAHMAAVDQEKFEKAAPEVLRHFNLLKGKYRNKKLALLRTSALSRRASWAERGRKGGSAKAKGVRQMETSATASLSVSVSPSASADGNLYSQKPLRARDNGEPGYDPGPGWERFRGVGGYPNIRDMNAACRAWVSVCTSAENEAEIFAGLARWKKSNEWARGVYNSAERWLLDKLWKGQPAEAQQTRKINAVEAAMRAAKGRENA